LSCLDHGLGGIWKADAALSGLACMCSSSTEGVRSPSVQLATLGPSTTAKHLLFNTANRTYLEHLHAALTDSSNIYISTANMDLSESQATFPSDSEIYDANYDANHSNSQDSEEQTSHSSSPLILYSPPTFLSIARGAAINLLLPFINGLMLGFGELFAHEAAFRLGWGGTRVRSSLLCGGG
jgi:hypothetical protein